MSDVTNVKPPTTEEINRRIRESNEWYGYVHLGNAEAVADRIRSMLTGRRFTFVSYNVNMTGSWPEVRTGQRLNAENVKTGKAVTYRLHNEASDPWGHFMVHDSYGVWGFSAHYPDAHQAYDAARRDKRDVVHVVVTGGFDPRDRGQIKITQYNGIGDVLRWTIALEPSPDPDLVAAVYRQSAGLPGTWHEPGEEATAFAKAAIKATQSGWEDVDTRYR